MDVTCENCSFWKRRIDKVGRGECRVHPPLPGIEDMAAAWPVTSGSDWCGEHQRVLPGEQA